MGNADLPTYSDLVPKYMSEIAYRFNTLLGKICPETKEKAFSRAIGKFGISPEEGRRRIEEYSSGMARFKEKKGREERLKSVGFSEVDL